MNDVHDPYDPASPAADLQQGSIETMRMLDPVTIFPADRADLPDNPDEMEFMEDTLGTSAHDAMIADDIDRTTCMDPAHEQAVQDRDGGNN